MNENHSANYFKKNLKKNGRIIIISLIFLFNTAAFQNCSKFSSQSISSVDGARGGVGRPVADPPPPLPVALNCTGIKPAIRPFPDNHNFRCDSNQIVTSSMSRSGWGFELWSDGKHHGDRRWKPSDIPAQGITISDIPSQRFAMDSWAEIGGTSISVPVPWDAIHVQPDQFIFEPIDWILDYAICKKMKVILKVGADANGVYHSTADWRFTEAEAARDRNGNILGDKGMSYSSAKWESNYKKFLTKLADHIFQSGRSSAVYYVTPVTTTDDEFGYKHDSGKDYSNLETQAWREWLKNKYGANQPYGDINQINQPDDIGGSGINRDWFIFRSERLNRIAKIFGEAFQSKGFKTVLDAGSFVDPIKQRNTWALPSEGGGSYISGFKQNPAFAYNPELNAKVLSCSGKWSSNEWTWSREEDGNSYNNLNVNNFVDRVKRSINAGVTDISYSFFEPRQKDGSTGLNYSDFVPHPEIANIMSSLSQSGYLNKRQQCKKDYSKVVNFSLQQILNNGGFGNYENELRTAIQQSGVDNTCVNLQNDLDIKF